MRSATLRAATLAFLANQGVDAASSTFPRAVSGEGFLAVPVSTIKRPHGDNKVSGRASGNAFETTLQNMDFFYATDVAIGTPPQTVTVLVDTGSSELWVNPDCRTAPSISQIRQCIAFGQYDPSQSKTPADGPLGSEKLNYGDPSDISTQSSVVIEYYTDTISLGKAKITNQTFGVVSQSQGQSQGIMGLAPDLRGGFDGDEPYSLLLNTMADQGVIDSRIFSLDLRHSEEKEGAVIYGGIDRSKFIGNLEELPIVRGTRGEFRLAVELDTLGATFNGNSDKNTLSKADTNVMLDSGTTITRLHASAAQPILRALGAQQDKEGYYYTSCAARRAAGTIDFGFGNKVINVPLSDFIMDVGDENVCYIGLVTTTDQQIIGDSVLRAGYFVFDWDNEVVHVAQAANCGDSDIVAVGKGKNAVPDVQGKCKESDANVNEGASNNESPTQTTFLDGQPTAATTKVYTITSCPPFDKSCQTGRVGTETIEPQIPTQTNSRSTSGGNSSGGDDGSAGVRASVALSWVVGVFSLSIAYIIL